MKNYVIAKTGKNMDGNWMYALSVEGREAFIKGSKSEKFRILQKLFLNGNITTRKMIEITK